MAYPVRTCACGKPASPHILPQWQLSYHARVEYVELPKGWHGSDDAYGCRVTLPDGRQFEARAHTQSNAREAAAAAAIAALGQPVLPQYICERLHGFVTGTPATPLGPAFPGELVNGKWYPYHCFSDRMCYPQRFPDNVDLTLDEARAVRYPE